MTNLFRVLCMSILLFHIGIGINTTFAQNHDIFQVLDSNEYGGKISIYQNSSVYNTMQKQILINKKIGGIPKAYRIQIFSSSGNQAREKAIGFKKAFIENHPEFESTEIYLLYQPPFFKLRLGDYRNKHEAILIYNKLVKYYPNCYIVKSKINFPKLIEE